MRVQAILFDLGDTLFGLRPMDDDRIQSDFASALQLHAGLATNAAFEAAAGIFSRLREQWRESYLQGETLERRVSAGALEQLSVYGAAAGGLAASLDDAFARADIDRFEPPSGCAARVEAFRARGYRLAAVSNTATTPAMLDRFLAGVGLLPLFEAVVYSVVVGHRKPSPVIYETALGQLGIPAGRALFVGDRVREDVVGPHAVGLRAVLTHEFRQEPPRDSRPEAVISRLPELQSVLARLDA
ncbi:MAG: HAD family hydrolase [Tepidiformaceae bacterium]